MSWIKESTRNWLEKFCINVLKTGSIPQHVAFIMDGNRRYAKKVGLEKIQGHALGFEKLSETLEWCFDLGIREVTLYTFSIENFKRPEDEVNGLMNLAIEKFRELLEEKEKLDEYEVCIRILGDITLLPVELQKLVAEVVLYTYNNKKAFLNLCLAYTSREEIANAVKEIAQEVVQGNLQTSDITEDLLNSSLYTAKSSPPDIIVRTSGEVRLSDFLCWQGSYSVLSFFKVTWPEFSIWHLFSAVLYYQLNFMALKEARLKHEEQNRLLEIAESLCNCQELQNTPCIRTHEHICLTEPERSRQKTIAETRRKNFINHLESDRYTNLVKIKNCETVQNRPPFS